ncbi:transport permease protein [Luteimonas padinae]|jgi:lipopolysaccharide transport system permease protein|uniref:Transport permease protein n=2 Tax=Luteimonas TaxID=83614 RepID=A0ABV6SY35_9GAMM|nr:MULTISPECIES: ABC transporter permease [Luteimonas]GHD71420.1 transport permease protein [Luteimonas padinae]
MVDRGPLLASSAPGQLMRSRNPFAAFGRHRNLTRELVRNEILGRYRGASFGMLWSLLSPFLMLVVYTVAFGSILKGRWPQAGDTHAEFGLVIFVGIFVHGFFAECFTRSPRLMLENANYVKRVVFPLDILPWTMALSALFHLAMNVLVFCLLSFFVYRQLSPLVLLLPLVLAPLAMLTVAVCWVTSSLGVYLRDIAQVTPVVATAMFFLSSAIVPVQAVPERYQLLFQLNPLTFFIDQARNVALWGRQPDWSALGLFALAGLVAMFAAHAWFQRTSRGFADVL